MPDTSIAIILKDGKLQSFSLLVHLLLRRQFWTVENFIHALDFTSKVDLGLHASRGRYFIGVFTKCNENLGQHQRKTT